MEIEFVKTSPTQNMTILVTSPVPQQAHLAVAEQLMAYDNIYGEQVGYIITPKNPDAKGALSMMAGEFCGNATLSLGAWLMEEENLPVGTTQTMHLEVSGAEHLIACTITKGEKDYFGIVAMPLAKEIKEMRFPLEGEMLSLPVVVFEGITHVIVDQSIWGVAYLEKAKKAAKAWAQFLPQAFGILIWDGEEKKLTPLVCVQGSSLVWERGCGSGTSAIGAYLAAKTGRDVSLACLEPGGSMEVSVTMKDGAISSIAIGGHVSIVAKGVAYVTSTAQSADHAPCFED